MRVLILHLGGAPRRITTTLNAMAQRWDAHCLISSETQPGMLCDAIHAAKESLLRFEFDFEAWDTVTNLTAAWRRLHAFRGIYRYTDVVLVTDAFHMPRAAAIARVVFAGLRVRVHGVSDLQALGGRQREPWRAIARDVLRAAVWKLTGRLPHSRRIRAQRHALLDAARRELITIASGEKTSSLKRFTTLNIRTLE